MAASSASAPTPAASAIGQALVDFSTKGLFPAADDVATASLRPETLPDAIRVLADAKTTLETEIQSIVSDTAGDVQAWIDNAKALQVAIARRKTLAADILVRANDSSDTPASEEQSGRQQSAAEAEAEAHARFLTGELNYNLQVRYLLEAIRSVSRLLDDVEQASTERRILDALRLLERAWSALDAMPVSKSCRAMRLLDLRAFELKADVHGVFDHVWSALVRVAVDERNPDAGGRTATLTINETRADEPMSLSDAVIGLKAYKEVDHRMADLWHALDKAIVAPRTDLSRASRPRIYVNGPELGISEHNSHNGTKDDSSNENDDVEALFEDLEKMFSFLAKKLPADLVQSISSVMMPELVTRVIDVWLASSVPTSLDQMAAFEGTLTAAQGFCARLTELHYTGFGHLQDWIESAPRVWLSKRKEAALNTVRANVAKGLGEPHQVEKIEKQMVSRSEGKELAAAPAAATGTTEQASDWNTAWSDEEEDNDNDEESRPAAPAKAPKTEATADNEGDDGADAWAAWGDDDDAGGEPEEETAAAEEDPAPEPEPEPEPAAAADDDDDDAADAWGWGDEDGGDNDESNPPSPKKAKKNAPEPTRPTPTEDTATREMIMKEKYYISSMPGPLLDLIKSILEDSAALTSGAYEGSSVSAAGAGLFSVPSLALAMFRAVSPHFYASDVGGSMYLYNDAMYLAERLGELATAWKDRLPPTAASMLRLDAEAAKLQGFASRAYGREMAVQKTVLRDLLGGDQNVLQGNSSPTRGFMHPHPQETDEDADDYVDAAVARVRSMAAAWEDVLAPSAWSQAVGSLADAVAQKLIIDVLDMPSISQDEAFSLAKLIQKVTELDDLFRKSTDGEDTEEESVPMTSQYAPNWLRLQYLSEVLQSNLREVQYLWMESELSLYFTAEEVVDLLRLSFEDNARSRETAREIAANPHPVHV